MKDAAERISRRYLRRLGAMNEMQYLGGIANYLSSIQNWAAVMGYHAQTMRALIAAGEARRLGRTSDIKIKKMDWKPPSIQAVVQGTTGVYQTRITLTPRGHHCTCPDWQKNGRTVGPCKHVLKLGQVWLDDKVLADLDQALKGLWGVIQGPANMP